MLGRQIGAAVLEHLAEDGRFVGPADEEDYAGGLIENWKSESDSVGVELFYPVGDNQTMAFIQCGGLRKKGSGVAVWSQAQENEIKARHVAR